MLMVNILHTNVKYHFLHVYIFCFTASAEKRLNVTEFDVREAIGPCLIYAPDRRGGDGRQHKDQN